jgi:hypothetical protein
MSQNRPQFGTENQAKKYAKKKPKKYIKMATVFTAKDSKKG